MKKFLPLLMLVSACAGSPTSPTAAPGTSRIGSSVKSSNFPYIGHATTVNTSGSRACFWLSAWDASKDAVNQTFLKGSGFSCVDPGDVAEMWLAFDDSKQCKVQIDIFKFGDPPPTLGDRPTLNELNNSFWDAPGGFFTKECKPVSSPPPPPLPQCHDVVLNFPAGSYIARFPITEPVPWLLEKVGPFAVNVPAGKWHVTEVTGDNHVGPDGKNDGTQAAEIGDNLTDSSQVIGPTKDIPDDQNSAFTDFGVVNIASAVHSILFRHAGPVNPPFATNSFYPVVLTFGCVAN